MNNGFRFKLTISHIMVVILALVIMGALTLPKLDQFYVKHLEDYLTRQGRVLAEMVGTGYAPDGERMQALARRTAKDSNCRVTIINRDGRVLGDSENNPVRMENHRGRPEVRTALEQGKVGIARRYSTTMHYDMLYVAVPVISGGKVMAAVRLAITLASIRQLQGYLLYVFLLSLLIAVLAGAVASVVMSRRLSGPLSEITEAAQDMAAGNLNRRLYHFEDDDLGRLSLAFNSMAAAMAANIKEISLVKNRLETVLYTTLNGVLLVDNQGRVEFINPAMKAMLQLDPGYTYVGDNFVEVTGSYDFAHLVDMVKERREQVSMEITMYSRGEQTVEAQGVPVIADDGRLKGVLMVAHDITKLKRLEQVRRDFVANVSHELKTPVAAISGFAETLINEAEDPDTVREFAGIIYSEAGRMERMVKSLTELSRLETGSITLKLEEIDLGVLAGEAAALLKSRGSDFQFLVNGEARVRADRDLLLQVFTNLFDNAIKYSHPPAWIEVNLKSIEDRVRVEVRDRGVGIPANELHRVFERFYRVDKARSRQTGGAGLGLSIVRHIIEVHGGTVGVNSQYGEGSTFYFTLPA